MLVGYLLNTEKGPAGEPGVFYDYILAGNGLLLEADNGLLRARVLLASAEVRGLPALEPFLQLRHGTVPAHLLALAVNAMPANKESYAAIAWDGQAYRLVIPPQEASSAHVTYETVPSTVVGLHSHGAMEAFFSYQDDRDEHGFQVSVVVGRLDRLLPAIRARLSVYGYFTPLRLGEVAEGILPVIEEA